METLTIILSIVIIGAKISEVISRIRNGERKIQWRSKLNDVSCPGSKLELNKLNHTEFDVYYFCSPGCYYIGKDIEKHKKEWQ